MKDTIPAGQLTRNDFQGQTVPLDQTCHLKDNTRLEATAGKLRQHANLPKKRVLGYYNGQVVQSKVNSFRKLPNVKGESPAATKNLPATVAPIRSLHNNTQGTAKQGLSRTLTFLTDRKGPLRKKLPQSEPVVPVVNTGPQDTRSITCEGVARTNLSNSRQIGRSKNIDECRYTKQEQLFTNHFSLKSHRREKVSR